MLHWALLFFIVAIVASMLGFGGPAATAFMAGNTLIKVFLVLLIVGFIFQMVNQV